MLEKIKNNKSLLLIILCFLIFIISFLIHYYPVYKKGYPPSISAETMILARNLALTGEYKSQDKIGTVLASGLIKEKGDDSIAYNKLTAVFYSYIFKLFGFNQNLPLFICLILFSLSSVILFILTFKLFNLKIALLQALVFNLLPIISYSSVYFGSYELGIFFFSLGLLFYFWTTKENNKYIFLLIASIFFTIASIARSAFLLSFALIILYEFFKNRNFKRIIIFLFPLIIGWLIYLVPDYLHNRVNSYISGSQQRFGLYGHLFPDPYTYYFDKDNFLNKLVPNGPNDLEFLTKLGRPIGLINQFKMYFASATFYPWEIMKIAILGGPLIILLMFYGFRYLWHDKKDLAKFILLWFSGLYILLIILKTNNWDHFLEISFPLSLLVSLGIFQITQFFKNNKLIKFWPIVFIIFLIGHFIYANQWMYHEEYSASNIATIQKMTACINSQSIGKEDVIAVNLHPEFPDHLNYFTNKNFVHFSLETTEKLLNEEKLNQALEKYQVKWVIGYPVNLENQIEENLKINVIPCNYD